MDISRIKGIIPPIITPVMENEDIDESGLRKIVNHCIENKLHGVFVAGTMGESLSMTQEQRDRAIKISLDEANGRVPVLAGVMDSSTRRVIENVKRAEQMGAEYVVVSPTFYAAHTCPQEVIRHYEYISRNTEAKIIIYNIPGCVGTSITPKMVYEIAEIDKVVGIKDSGGNFGQFMNLVNHFKGTDFKIFQGITALSGLSILMGADGLVLCFAPIFPDICLDLYESALRKDLDRLERLAPVIEMMSGLNNMSKSNVSATKYAMSLFGYSDKRAIRPTEPVKPDEEIVIRNAVRSINEEYQKLK